MDYVINIEIHDENTDNFCERPTFEDGTPMGLLDFKYRGMNTAEVFKLLEESDDDGGEGGEGGGLDSHDWDGAEELTPKEKDDLEREIDQAIRQGALSAGKMGGDISKEIGDLLAPQIDWREVLREFVATAISGNDYSTYRRPNRRFVSHGIYLSLIHI